MHLCPPIFISIGSFLVIVSGIESCLVIVPRSYLVIVSGIGFRLVIVPRSHLVIVPTTGSDLVIVPTTRCRLQPNPGIVHPGKWSIFTTGNGPFSTGKCSILPSGKCSIFQRAPFPDPGKMLFPGLEHDLPSGKCFYGPPPENRTLFRKMLYVPPGNTLFSSGKYSISSGKILHFRPGNTPFSHRKKIIFQSMAL